MDTFYFHFWQKWNKQKFTAKISKTLINKWFGVPNESKKTEHPTTSVRDSTHKILPHFSNPFFNPSQHRPLSPSPHFPHNSHNKIHGISDERL